MRSLRNVIQRGLLFLLALFSWSIALEAAISPADIEFFEKRIRPVLVQDCYECHRTGVSEKGELALDYRDAVKKGGRSGEIIVPGKPEESLLIKALHHAGEIKMPKSGAKLEPSIIADFERWVKMGAPDPRDHPAKDAEVETDSSWDAQMRRRASWWSFQPISKPSIPPVLAAEASRHPVDRFVRAKLSEVGLAQAPKAEKRILIRRLSYALRGLPPAADEVEAFERDTSISAYERLLDNYLGSVHFGEHWARHWMDWVRYADSHGSEGDPMIPYAWQYRDYLIRALNRDVPYDQLLREHIAGDLLQEPRINRELGVNESALGIGHFRMVLHGFAPTDALEERVRNIDDQIDVLSKAFLGITVSCARCHNHKFDAISQKDFYALYGVLAATTPASIGVGVQSSDVQKMRSDLDSQKKAIKSAVVESWIARVDEAVGKILQPGEKLSAAISGAKERRSILNLLHRLQKPGVEFGNVVAEWKSEMQAASRNNAAAAKRWNLSNDSERAEWIGDGAARFSPAGAFTVASEGDRVVDRILPAGVYSHLTSEKDRAVYLSPKFELDRDYDLWLRVAGDGGAVSRYVVQNYPRDGSIYPVTRLNGGDWRWVKHPMNYWTGDRVHVEFSTAADQAVLADVNARESWFGIRDVIFVPRDTPAPVDVDGNEALLSAVENVGVTNAEGVARAYAKALRELLAAWREDRADDGQADFLNQAIQLGLIDNSFNGAPAAKLLVESYRQSEKRLPEPIRAPGLIETGVEDQPLLVRGDHKTPGEVVPRRFLEAFSSKPYAESQSGRLELAEDFLKAGDPLTSRVIVNRVWHHLFGRGLVATPDNFGRLGEKPSHPELLDFLAGWFVENDYSIKRLIRFIVMSDTWQASRKAPAEVAAKDPENKYLGRANVRRLEAESIRDSLLATSGNLKEEMYGPPVLGSSTRRSVYVRIKRNDLDLFLSTFDAPVPSGTKGRRDVTNVPGQSLALLNDPFVFQLADRWAEQINSVASNRISEDGIQEMFMSTLGRRVSAAELKSSQKLLEEFGRQQDSVSRARNKISEKLSAATQRRDELKRAAEARVKAGRSQMVSTNLPQPVASWDFRRGLEDQVGHLHGRAHGNARIENGALWLDGRGSYVSTPPLEFSLDAKTMEAWVQLETLSQQGGGVVTVQDLAGEVFDSIVFGEQRAGHWVVGSDFFSRSADLSGPAETEAKDRPVHIAVTHAKDGTVTLYRNGERYGKSFKSNGPFHFVAGKSQVLFGNRHGAPGGNRNLTGRIYRARLFAKALDAEEIATLASDDADFITEQSMLAALTATERQEFDGLDKELAELKLELNKIENEKGLASPYANLAHALFNLKEFIYVQ